jgi:hypothetical protein
MVVVPLVIAFTTPLGDILATVVLVLDHIPPEGASDSKVVVPIHPLGLPDIGSGTILVVTLVIGLVSVSLLLQTPAADQVILQ